MHLYVLAYAGHGSTVGTYEPAQALCMDRKGRRTRGRMLYTAYVSTGGIGPPVDRRLHNMRWR